jgi:N-acetylglutamate synthase-like GNAT family acetyltransferase
MEIKKANLKEIKEIKEISKEYKFGLQGAKEMYILLKDKKIIGFTGLIYHKWNNTLQVSDIFIIPEYRRKSYGLKLIKFLVNKAKKTNYRSIIAEAPSLSNAPKLYEKAGFRKCGYNDRYYSNSGKEIALWYSYDLK